MLAKKTTKKLYVDYKKECTFDDFYNKTNLNPGEKFKSFSAGKAKCRRYYTLFTEWLNRVTNPNSSDTEFGVEFISEDSLHLDELSIQIGALYSEKLGEIITRYFDDHYGYYYEIETESVYLTESLTGHLYYNSPYESDDNCGTCDGEKCATCRRKYKVLDFKSDEVYYDGYNKKDAEAELKSREINYADVIADVIVHYGSLIDYDWMENKIGDKSGIKQVLMLLEKLNILYKMN